MKSTIFKDFYAALPPSYKLSCAVIWSFGHLSKSKTDVSKPALYINIYIVSNDRISEIENDQMTMTK